LGVSVKTDKYHRQVRLGKYSPLVSENKQPIVAGGNSQNGRL